MDTMLVNGTAYPTVTVNPQAYRFRILSAGNDRFLNLQWYLADDTYAPTDPGFGKEVKMVPSALRESCSATVTTNCVCTATDAPAGCFPDTWPADGREGGVPDPAMRGPAWVQIGTEGGFLPGPVVRPNIPVTWNYDPTTFDIGNVNGGALILAPAERADVIVDFSQFAGKTLILYNDAPTAFPALVPQYDYYTGAPDRRGHRRCRRDIAGLRSERPDGHAGQGGGKRRHRAPRLLQPGDLDRAGEGVPVGPRGRRGDDPRDDGSLRTGAGPDHRGADGLRCRLQQDVPHGPIRTGASRGSTTIR